MDKQGRKNARGKQKRNKTSISNYIKRFLIIVISILFIGCVAFKVYQEINVNTKIETKISYTDFLKKVKAGEVEKIIYRSDSNDISFTEKNDKSETEYTTSNPKYENFKKDMLEKNVEFEEVKSVDTSAIFNVISIFVTVIMLMAIIKIM